MTPSQIIAADAQQHGVNPALVLNFVAHNIQAGKASLLQHGNSILLLTRIGENAMECHLYTQDAPLALRSALANFVATIRKSPVRVLYGQADNPGIIRMLNVVGLRVMDSDRPKYNWMAEV